MTDEYRNAGVDVAEADKGIEKITRNIKTTWPKEGVGQVMLDIGYFANVINLGDGRGLAQTTDGVGSKTIIADMMDDYETIGIDCVAMNVNDLICVGAKPLTMVDYIGIEEVSAEILEEISVGLMHGANKAGISISGGEVSQLGDSITGFDLVGSASGLVDLDKMIIGQGVEPGDRIIGIRSTGVHSNGLSLARRIFFDDHNLDQYEEYEDLGKALGYELLTPTAIYVPAIMQLLDWMPVKALINITGDGLLNLNRVKAQNVGFVLDGIPLPTKIFEMIQSYGEVSDATMYQTFNMGVGFCVIVNKNYQQEATDIINSFENEAIDLGVVIEDQYKTVHIPSLRLFGRGKQFHYR